MKPLPEEIIEFACQNRPGFEPKGSPVQLSGGNLNYVWRVHGKSESLIVKHAPPHIASSPDIPLNPNRLEFEARALKLFHSDGNLSNLSGMNVRPPAIYGFSKSGFLLLMEDISSAEPWFPCVKKGDISVNSAKDLGFFIGELHGCTYRDKSLAKVFSNRPIQQTRLTVQYHSVEDSLLKAGFDNVAGASKNAVELGEELLSPGRCLIMGDLWPPSVLVQNGYLRIIDWEFSHFGRPLQDLAHFGAHCYMHSLFSDTDEHLFKTVWINFLDGYKNGARDSYPSLLDKNELKWMPIHFGAEILVRTAGPFREFYLFSELKSSNPLFNTAVKKAYECIASPHKYKTPAELW